MEFGESMDERTYKEIGALTTDVVNLRKVYPRKIMKLLERKAEQHTKILVNASVELKNEATNFEISSMCSDLKKSFQLLSSNVNSSNIFDRLEKEQQNQRDINLYIESLRNSSEGEEMEE